MIPEKILIITLFPRIDTTHFLWGIGSSIRRSWRFEQSDLQLAQKIECLPLSDANRNVTEITDPVSKFIGGDIDNSWLAIPLPMVQAPQWMAV